MRAAGGDIDRPLAIRAMKRFLVEWHEASGIPDVLPPITPREERVAVVGAGPAGIAVARELAVKGYRVTVFDSLPFAGDTMLIGVPAFRLPREAIEMDVRLVERLGVTFRYNTKIGRISASRRSFATSIASRSAPERWTRWARRFPARSLPACSTASTS